MTDISNLIDYHIWATGLITRQVLALPEDKVNKETGGSFPSIRLTLEHLFSADYLWVSRWKGSSQLDFPGELGTLAQFVATWKDVQQQMKELAVVVAQQSEQGYRFTTRKGTSHELPFLDVVLQITHHGSYHRGQIANMIRMQGETPVATDYFLFCVK
jgi:uncharacterized damage-inducible protein DinB